MDGGGAPHFGYDASGQMVATYPDGTVVPVQAPAVPAIAAEGTPNAVPSAAGGSVPPAIDPRVGPGTGAVDAGAPGGNSSYGDATYSTRSGYSSGRSYGGGSYGGGGSGYDDSYVPHPQYADGQLHPAWGGSPRVAGGPYAVDDGFDDRQQMNVPGGASAGPFEISSAPPPESRMYGGGSFSGGGSGGGGGNSSAMYQNLRAKGDAMAAKVRGMGSSVGSGSSGYSSGSTTTSTSAPKPPKMHGQYAHGMDPAQAAGLSLRPTAMLPDVFPGLGPDSPAYAQLAGLPAAQLAMLSNGYKGKPSDLPNALGKVYQKAGSTGALPSTGTLLKNLRTGKGVDAMFEGQKAGPGDYESYSNPGYVYGAEPLPLGEAATAFGGLLDASLVNLPTLTQSAYGSQPGGYGSYLTDRWASKALKKPAGKGTMVNTYVTKRLFSGR